MSKERTVLELLNMASESYKQKVAIKQNKDLNYFSYRFDVLALEIALKRILANTSKSITIIISENRVEWLNAYLASVIMGNDVIIMPNNFKADVFGRIINKYKVNTVFYSNNYRDKIIRIVKERKVKKENLKLNLINFDQEKNLNVIDYQKILNAGRYLENNYPINENEIEEGKTIFITNNREVEFTSDEIIKSTLELVKKIHIWNFWNKKITATHSINNEYDVCIQIILPLIMGNTLNYDFARSSSKDLIIQRSNNEFCEICKKRKTYRVWTENGKFVMTASKRKKTPKFEILTNTELEKIKSPQYKENFILIK